MRSLPPRFVIIAARLTLCLALLALAMPWNSRTAARATAAAPLLIDINPGDAASNPNAFVTAGSLLFFTADDGAHGTELWRSDGTAAGTWMLKDMTAGAASTNIHDRVAIADTLFFLRYTGDPAVGGTVELWRSDGTQAGTALVEEIGPWTFYRGCQYSLARFGAKLTITSGSQYGCPRFVTIHSGAPGGTLWRTAGTQIVLPGERGALFFASEDANAQSGLWVGADTAEGIAYAGPAPTSYEIRPLGADGDTEYFTAYSHDEQGFLRPGVWKTIASGATLVALLPYGAGIGDSIVVGHTLFFVLAKPTQQIVELWRSDGTAAGTSMVHPILVGDQDPNGAPVGTLTQVGARVAFTGPSGCDPAVVNRYGLWASAGTAASTGLVSGRVRIARDYQVGARYYRPMASFDEQIVFFGDDGVHGVEPWISDGTDAGTRLLADLVPGADDASPFALAALPGKILVSADDGASGRELWVLDPTPPPAPAPEPSEGEFRLYLPLAASSPTCATP